LLSKPSGYGIENGELRYVLGGAEQLLLNAGITFTIE